MTSSTAIQEAYVGLFAEHSRKQNINVIFTSQELFPNNAALRSCIKNATYHIVYPFFGDMLSIGRFFHRIFNQNAKMAKEALIHANNLKKEYCGFLLIDVHPHSKLNHLKVRNFIGPIHRKNCIPKKELEAINETLFPKNQLFVYNLL